MTDRNHEIVKKVEAAKANTDRADLLIREYMPYIRSEAAKNMKKQASAAGEDERQVAMFAFHEAIMGYDRTKGSFLNYASLVIKSRITDYHRKEARYRRGIAEVNLGGEDDMQSVIEKLDKGREDIKERHDRLAACQEIAEFSETLAAYGLSLDDVSQNCPKQERTFRACKSVVEVAAGRPEMMEKLTETKKLPVAELTKLSGVERKTIERHRKYIVALLLAFTNGFEIIRGHIRQVGKKTVKGGTGA